MRVGKVVDSILHRINDRNSPSALGMDSVNVDFWRNWIRQHDLVTRDVSLT